MLDFLLRLNNDVTITRLRESRWTQHLDQPRCEAHVVVRAGVNSPHAKWIRASGECEGRNATERQVLGYVDGMGCRDRDGQYPIVVAYEYVLSKSQLQLFIKKFFS